MRANILLFIAAAIWGFGFVAQRAGMEYVGPFTFNAVRFALGAITLIPLLLFKRRSFSWKGNIQSQSNKNVLIFGSIAAGFALFAATSLQQNGIVFTTAGKAGFITGLYVIIVPLLGLAWKEKTHFGTWIGAVLAVFGLYLISMNQNMQVILGDLLVLGGAFFWAIHVHVIGRFSTKIHPLKLAFIQFAFASILSLICALLFETIIISSILTAWKSIIFAGVFSVGIAFTLQVIAQQEAHSSHAALILSLESVFAVIGGWLILHEGLSIRGIIGCALMLTGMLLSRSKKVTDNTISLG